MVIEALLLGLSSGSYCLFNCAPVGVPLFLDEDLDRRNNFKRLFIFLSGRLIGYLLFGFIIGLTGAYIAGYFDPYIQQTLESWNMVLVGFLLILTTGIGKNRFTICLSKFVKRDQYHTPLIFGLLTGLSLCPPFFVAASRVFGQGGSFTGLVYFLFFFLGTSVYILPFGGFYLFNRFTTAVKFISKYLRILIGFYFVFILGIIPLIIRGVAL